MADGGLSIRSGLRWAAVAQAVNALLGLAGLALLARLLTPADYGLMAMAMIVIAFALLFKDLGTGVVLIQVERLDDTLLDSVLLLNLGVGVVLAGVVALVAPWVAAAFGEPRLGDVVLAMAPLFLVAAASVVPQSLLERRSAFRRIAAVEAVGQVIGLAAAAALAVGGWGVYALVAQSLVAASVGAIGLWHAAGWRPRFRAARASYRAIWKFSGNLMLFNLVNFVHRHADSTLIGRALGSVELGTYNLAYRILNLPVGITTQVVNRAALPVYSRHQREPATIAHHYLGVLATISFGVAPLMALIWALRESVLLVALGPQWLPSAAVLAWLAPVGWLQAITSTSGSLLSAIGRTDLLRNLGFVGVPFLVASIAVGLQWGIVGVAACYAVANLVWVAPVIGSCLLALQHRPTAFLRAVLPPAILAVLLAWPLRLAAGPWLSSQPVGVLVSGVAVYATAYLLLSRRFWPAALRDRLARRQPDRFV